MLIGYMDIIIRSCGERTADRCEELAKQHGNTHTILAVPFSESIWQSYQLAIELDQDWTPIIDADVLLYDGVLETAIKGLQKQPTNVFCLDGKTDDKIFGIPRRAGIHIYRTSMLPTAMNFIAPGKIKPETHIRKEMDKLGGTTCTSKIIFGKHDYEQYYCDLWRKSICQFYKLHGMIEKTKIIDKWKKLSEKDNDFKVILAAHNFAKQYINKNQITIDKKNDYNSNENIEFLGLEEKKEMR